MKRTIKPIKKVFYTAIISLLSFGACITSCQTNSNGGKDPYSYLTVDDTDFENMEALQFTKIMGNGINLGNTFETNAADWVGYNANPSSYETGWGQPITTKAMFKAYKEAGFDSVRIPIAWTSTMDWRNNDFKINDDFIERIKTVVDYALENDLIVMINDHWDYQWWGLFGSNKTLAYNIFDEIWDQVGTYFKDYPYQLIFEAGNEEWGQRFNDEVDGVTGNLSLNQQYALIEELGQHFVDKIRNQGSKNEKRFLLIPGYNTDFEHTVDSRYKMPKDPTNSVNKLLVSVHYYAPALYSLVSEPVDWGGIKQPATKWGTASEIKEQNDLFSSLTKFVNEGYGVIIGEYAVAKLKNSDGTFTRKDNDIDWLTNVLDNCDKYNYAPFLWDCNGYFHKTGELGFTGNDSDVAAVYKNRNYASEKPTPEEPSTPDSTIKTASIENDGSIEYTMPVNYSANDTILIQATINGASNFNQIGFQTNADDSQWHSDWSNTGFENNSVISNTITATTSGTEIYFKYIFQNLIDESKETSSITISNVTIKVN